jgi:epoxyqueuosine reductase
MNKMQPIDSVKRSEKKEFQPASPSLSLSPSPSLSPVLLHACCAPCAAPSIERLLDNGQKVVIFYANSNIYPYEEYLKRLSHIRRLADFFTVEVIEDTWDHDAWLKAVRGLENEPEGGKRCQVCFAFNLARTRKKADELNMELFTTTLTLSPHKNSPAIFSIGNRLGGFLEENFKKKEGFKRSLQLSKELNLYRQSYCGCEFSLRSSLPNSMNSQSV